MVVIGRRPISSGRVASFSAYLQRQYFCWVGRRGHSGQYYYSSFAVTGGLLLSPEKALYKENTQVLSSNNFHYTFYQCQIIRLDKYLFLILLVSIITCNSNNYVKINVFSTVNELIFVEQYLVCKLQAWLDNGCKMFRLSLSLNQLINEVLSLSSLKSCIIIIKAYYYQTYLGFMSNSKLSII